MAEILAVNDDAFQGWQLHADGAHARRFGRSDGEFSLTATHALPWRTYAGGSIGASAAGGLFPRLRVGAVGGAALAYSFSLETLASYRHYDGADVYSLAPALYVGEPWVLIDAAYGVAQTLFLSGAQSGVLSSYRWRIRWTRHCAARPWIAYARTREAFEPVNGQIVAASSADHLLAGSDFNAPGGWTLSPSFEYENRPSLAQHIDRWGVGLSRKFGRLSSIAGW